MNAITRALAEEGLDAGVHELKPLSAARDHAVALLPVAATAFEFMRIAAAAEGHQIAAVSGYRSVERQTEIWNRKFQRALDGGMDESEALRSNLVYSAPPGWSRHHWGTDVDLIDRSLETEVGVRLEVEDWSDGAPCAALLEWLDRNALEFGFARPYDEDRGGFAVEPWHWSFAPTAIALLPRMRWIHWDELLRDAPYAGAEHIAARVDIEFERFVLRIQPRLRVAISS